MLFRLKAGVTSGIEVLRTSAARVAHYATTPGGKFALSTTGMVASYYATMAASGVLFAPLFFAYLAFSFCVGVYGTLFVAQLIEALGQYISDLAQREHAEAHYGRVIDAVA